MASTRRLCLLLAFVLLLLSVGVSAAAGADTSRLHVRATLAGLPNVKAPVKVTWRSTGRKSYYYVYTVDPLTSVKTLRGRTTGTSYKFSIPAGKNWDFQVRSTNPRIMSGKTRYYVPPKFVFTEGPSAAASSGTTATVLLSWRADSHLKADVRTKTAGGRVVATKTVTTSPVKAPGTLAYGSFYRYEARLRYGNIVSAWIPVPERPMVPFPQVVAWVYDDQIDSGTYWQYAVESYGQYEGFEFSRWLWPKAVDPPETVHEITVRELWSREHEDWGLVGDDPLPDWSEFMYTARGYKTIAGVKRYGPSRADIWRVQPPDGWEVSAVLTAPETARVTVNEVPPGRTIEIRRSPDLRTWTPVGSWTTDASGNFVASVAAPADMGHEIYYAVRVRGALSDGYTPWFHDSIQR